MRSAALVGSLVVFLTSFLYYPAPLVAEEFEIGHNISTIERPGDVYFASQLWPGEGRPRFRARRTLVMHNNPSLDSGTIEGLRIRKGELIEFSETRVQTIGPAQISIKEDTTFAHAADYGPIKYLSRQGYDQGKIESLQVRSGDTILVLQYRAEGEFLIQVNGNVYGAQCAVCFDAKPETRWWVHAFKDSTSGWVLINEDNVEFLEREF